MPMGTRHNDTGLLSLDSGQYLLRRESGGTWQLEFGFVAGWRACRLVGRPVRVAGTRIGFDVLSVETVGALAP